MATNTTTATATTPDQRTYLDPVWGEERDVWTGSTIEELRQRLNSQEPCTSAAETPWELVKIRRARGTGRGTGTGKSAAIVVKRFVYCDPPDLDPFLASLYRKYRG